MDRMNGIDGMKCGLDLHCIRGDREIPFDSAISCSILFVLVFVLD
jgi:hypothetical protein